MTKPWDEDGELVLDCLMCILDWSTLDPVIQLGSSVCVHHHALAF